MVRRHPWLVVGMGLLAIVVVLFVSGAAYWEYANQVPSYPRPAVVIPVPNAYDDYVAAGQMSRAVGGSSVTPMPAVRAGGPGSAAASSRPRLGYEEDVPLEQVRAAVVRNRPALARLRQGFRRQYLNPPVTSFSQTFPELANFRELARVLLTEGKLAEREGRMGDAARSCLDCLHLGVEMPRGGVVIHGLVSVAIEAIGMSGLERVVDRLDGPSAAAAAREIVRLDRGAPRPADILLGEKEDGTAEMVSLFRQRPGLRQFSSTFGSGPGTPPSTAEVFQGLRFLFTPKRQIIDNYRTYMDAVIADARKPYYAASSLPPPPDDPINRMLAGIFSPFKEKWAMRDALWRILELRLAARAYQARHGAPAPSAAALVPAYLPAVPRDPFADKPLVYRVKGGRPMVYSRGPDGDDDGGKDLGSRAAPGMDGDIVTVRGARTRGR